MNKNNPLTSLQNKLDLLLEKQVKKARSTSKRVSGKEDYIYKIVLTLFGFIAVYEFGQWLIKHYTFQKALYVLVVISALYFFLKTFSKKSFASKTIAYLKKHKENIVYGGFVLYFLSFLLTFIFQVSDIFKYATYGMISLYLIFKALGFSIDYTIPKTELKNSVFLRLILISMSVMLVIAHYILSAYEVVLATNLIYILIAAAYLIGFIFIFGKLSFKDVVWYFKSRRFKRFVASNTYNILSLLVILLTLTGLSYKFGYFDGILNKTPEEVVVEVEEPIIEEPVEVIEVVETPTTRMVIKRIGDVYNFSNRLEVGSEGEDVSRLQGFLQSMKYLEVEPTGVFDETTRLALTSALREKCDWPETTKGILGVQAMACINNLDVQVEEDIPEEELNPEDGEEESESETIDENNNGEESSEVVVEEVQEVKEPEEVIVIEESPATEETPVVEEEPTIEEIQEEVIEETPVVETVEEPITTSEPEEEIEPEEVEEVQIEQIKRVSDLYIFTETLQPGNTGNQVSNLKDILSVLGYYKGELNADFDEDTRIALRNALIEKCNWPQSTQGILGPQARTCINTIALPSQ